MAPVGVAAKHSDTIIDCTSMAGAEADASILAEAEPFGDEEAQMEMLEQVELGAGEVSTWETKVEAAQKESKLLCVVCGVNVRVKKQSFCAHPCQADCKAARRQAKDQGAEAYKAFLALQRRGGAEFAEAIHTFQSRCAGAGRGWRRPAFQWVRYEMCIRLASRVQKGTKSVWLSRGGFTKWYKEENPHASTEQAFAAWAKELETLHSSRISPDKSEILWPLEKFVISFGEKSTEEATSYGLKDCF